LESAGFIADSTHLKDCQAFYTRCRWLYSFICSACCFYVIRPKAFPTPVVFSVKWTLTAGRPLESAAWIPAGNRSFIKFL